MDRLKPCPFCGGFAIYLEQRAFSRFGSGLDRFIAVQCYDCGSRTEGVRINGVESLAEQKEMAAEAWNRRAEDVVPDIDNAPTVDAVEVVHGRWEYGKWENGHWAKGSERCRCSVCHRDFAVDNLNIWHGCPQCLAKMDGGNEDG